MTGFKFNIGDIVCPDPTGEGIGPKGKVMALIQYASNARGYVVSVSSFGEGVIRRHTVDEDEICAAKD